MTGIFQKNILLPQDCPGPSNLWVPGAVQCARCCTVCTVGQWQKDRKSMLLHFRSKRCGGNTVTEPNSSIHSESRWCVKALDANGHATTCLGSRSWTPTEEAALSKQNKILKSEKKRLQQQALRFDTSFRCSSSDLPLSYKCYGEQRKVQITGMLCSESVKGYGDPLPVYLRGGW